MKIIVAGSRTTRSYQLVCDAIRDSGFLRRGEVEIVGGGAPGVDTLAKQFARAKDYPFREFPADWDTHGRAAGPIRNSEMAAYGDALVAVWDGESRGTRDMLKKAHQADLPIFLRFTTGRPDWRSFNRVIEGDVVSWIS